MQIYSGPIITLEHARLALRHIVARCPRCCWISQTNPYTLECHLKTAAEKATPIALLGRRIRCKVCKRRGIDLSYTQTVLEQWTDAIAWAKRVREREARKAQQAFEAETVDLETSWREAGWL